MEIGTKHKGKWFRDLVSSDSSYVEWARRIKPDHGPLRHYVLFIDEVEFDDAMLAVNVEALQPPT